MTRPDRLLVLLCLCSAFTAGGCGTFVPETGLNPTYKFSSIRSVGVFVQQSEKDDAQLLSNLLGHFFLSRGYRVTQLNHQLDEQTVKSFSGIGGYAELVDAIRLRPEGASLDAVVLVSATLKQSEFAVSNTLQGVVKGGVTPLIRGSIAMVDLHSGVLALGAHFEDTVQVLDLGKTKYFPEHSRYMYERAILRTLGTIPPCATETPRGETQKIPIVFYVDKSYRDVFPKTWMNRIRERVLFVNDIYYREFGFEFSIKEMRLWPSSYGASLKDRFTDLFQQSASGPWITIGLTLDKELARSWEKRSLIGLGAYPPLLGVVSAEPTYPQLSLWNPLNETITLAHELGHILGLPHSFDPTSLMFPTAVFMSFEFDSLSRSLIRASSHTATTLSQKERGLNQIRLLENAYRAGNANRSNILPFIAENARWLATDTGSTFSGLTVRRDTTSEPVGITDFVKDPALALAARGFEEIELHHWAHARPILEQVVDANPNFLDAQLALLRALHNLEEKKEFERRIKSLTKQALKDLGED